MVNITRSSLLLFAAGIFLQLHPIPASAATYYWDPLKTGGAGGGLGAWDMTSPLWADMNLGGTDASWINGSDAVFSGTAGNVALSGPISLGRLTFTSLGYTITTTDAAPLTITGGITANISTTRAINTIAGTGGVIMDGDQTIDLTNGLNISTVLSGSGTLTKSGTGAVGLSANNTYTGKFIVTGGLLGISSDAALGIVPTTFQADAIVLNGGGLLAGGVLSGPGNFNDPGAFALNANRGITLGVNGGTIRVGYPPGGILTVNGVISGVGMLTKSDGGTLVINANSTYQGGTTIAGGILQIGTGGTTGSLGAGTITFGTGSGNFLNFNLSDNVIVDNDIIAIGRANISAAAGKTVTLNGAMTGVTPGELWIHGLGTVIVNANARSSRDTSTVIENGTLQVSDLTRSLSSALGNGFIFIGQGSTPSTGAGISYTGDSVSTDSIVSVKTAFGFIDVTKADTTLTLTNGFGTGTNLLTKRGAGTLSLAGELDNTKTRFQVDDGTLLLAKNGLSTAHAVAGKDGLILNHGLVQITGNNGDQIYDSSTVQINGGVLDLNSHNEAFDGLYSNSPGGVVTNNQAGTTSTLTLGKRDGTDLNSTSTVFTGSIRDGAGTMALQKTGTGSLTLTGANAVGGGTSVTNGRLIVTGSLTGGVTEVTGDTDTTGKYSGGILGGTGQLSDVITHKGFISPGATATGSAIGILTTGTLDMSDGGTLEIAISTSTLESSLLQIQGDLSLGFSAAVLSLTEVGAASPLAVNTTFTIMSYTGIWDETTFLFGKLGSIEDGDTFTFGLNTYRLDYDAPGDTEGVTDVTLTVVSSVPEPATGGLFAAGLALLGCRWRRRKVANLNSGSTSFPS